MKIITSIFVLTVSAAVVFGQAISPLKFDPPLSLSSNHVSLPASDSTHNGYLSSADWITFNSKSSFSGLFTDLNFTNSKTIHLDLLAPLTLWSTGDTDDVTAHPYTAANSGIFVKDANNREVLRIWASDPDPAFENYNTWNLYIGFEAGLAQPSDNTSAGYNNVGIGYHALSAITQGLGNVALGNKALLSDTTGYANIAIGVSALALNIGGVENVAVGLAALEISDSNANTAIGYNALSLLVSGDSNVAVGRHAGSVEPNGVSVADTQMVFIGQQASRNTADHGAVFDNGIAIGAFAQVEASNTAVIGNLNVHDVYFGSTGGLAILHGVGSGLTSISESQITNLTTDLAGKVPTTRSLTINGTALDLSANRSWTVGDALVANPLSQFSATTSAQLAGVLSDETGFSSGALAVFSKSPSIDGRLNISSALAPSVKIVQSGGKSLALLAGTNGGIFEFEDSGFFGVWHAPVANVGDGLGTSGTLDLTVYPGQVRMQSSELLGWASADSYPPTLDTGLSRNAAGVVQVNNGTAGTFRDLKLRNLETTGTIDLGNASDTTIARSGAGAITVEGVQVLLSGAALGTPASGTLTNCTFPTLNQNTTGSAASLSVSGQTGKVTVTGITSTDRAKTVRDAADTILELGGSYTPTGTWTNLTMVTPTLGTPASGNLANCTFPTLNQNTTGSAASLSVSGQTGKVTVTGIASTDRAKTVRDAADTILELGGSYTPTGTWTNMTLVTPALGTPSALVATNATGTAASLTTGNATKLATARSVYGNNFDGSAAISGVPNAQILNGITNFNSANQSQVVSSGTEYYITSSNLTMPATFITGITTGTAFVWRVGMTKTAAGTGTFQILLKHGANGSTADTTDATITIGTQTAVADMLTFDLLITFTSTSAYYYTLIPRQYAARITGFGLDYPLVASFFNGTVSGLTTTTGGTKWGLSFKATTGTPTITVPMVRAQAFNVN